EKGRWRLVMAGSITALMILAPFLVAGKFQSVCTQYLNTAQYHPVLSANAHNLWWLISGGHGWRPDINPGNPISYRTVGILLFGLATLLSMLAVWQKEKTLLLAAAYQSLAFFILNTQIHENHLLPMFAPLAIVAALDRSV